jgi:hypothetical protein
MRTGIFAPDFAAWGGMKTLSSMSVFVLEDLCLSLRSLPPKEAMVPVVSNDMMGDAVWYEKRDEEGSKVNLLLGALRSFVSRLMSDVVMRLVRGGAVDSFIGATPPLPWPLT